MRDRVTLIMWAATVLLITITITFAIIRAFTDLPQIAAGAVPDDGAFEARYVLHPWLAYPHIVLGVVYLVGAPFQLSRTFRSRHRRTHRRLGRVLVVCGAGSGVFALAFGVPLSFGGAWQALATALFGSWFLISLLLGFRAIRSGDVPAHRRWMIRAFAVGLGVGTIRIWVGLFTATGLLELEGAFAAAFFLGLSMHVVVGEAWLRRDRRALRTARSSRDTPATHTKGSGS